MSLFPEAMAGTMDSGPGTFAGSPSPQTGVPAAPSSSASQSPGPPVGEEDAVLQHAYGLAAKAGDTAAMHDIHGRLLNYYQSQTAKVAQNDQENMGFWSNLRQGVGRGLERVVKGAGNDVGLVSDKDLKDSDELDKNLLSTTGGATGDVVGQVAATLPLSLAGGGAVGAAGKALPALGRGLGGLATRAAVAGGEGAVGAQLGGGDTSEGAEAGAGLSVLGSTGGKLVRGLVDKSDDYKQLQKLADDPDLFIPISQGGKGVAKGIYQHMLPYALGVEQQLDSQAGKASKELEGVAAAKGMPYQVDSTGKGEMVPPKMGGTMQQTAANIKDQYDQAYQNTVKSYAFNLPDEVTSKKGKPISGVIAGVRDNLSGTGLPKAHVDAIAGLVDQTLDEYSQKGVITGENLLRAKQAAKQALGGLRSPATGANIATPDITQKALGTFDDIVQDAIDEHKSVAAMPPKQAKAQGYSYKDQESARVTANDLENFQRLGPAQEEGSAVVRTANANKPNRGELKWAKLANEAPDGSQLQDLGQTAHSVLENESPGSVNPAGRHALHTAEGITSGAALTGAALGHTVGIPLIAGANLAATKTAQKGLYGDLGVQRALADAMRSNPRATRLTGALMRQGVSDNASR